MHVSQKGLEAIQHFEGCVLHAYRCEAGVLTIGYGHTGPDVVEGLEWTHDRAEEQLARDLERYERAVEKAITVPMTQGQFDALVSLCFNIGVHAFETSTLVRLFNRRDVEAAARQFVLWHKAAGKVSQNLLQRRAAELWTFARAT